MESLSDKFFTSNKNGKRALVLGGGGARGAFEIGVWKALNELGYQPDILTGTSVGALNGALFLQGDIEEAEKMWKQIETGHVLEYEFPLSIDSFKDYRRTLSGFIVDAIKQKGVSTDPLRQLIGEYLPDESKIRQSPILFGLSTTNYKTREIEYFFLEDIPNGELRTYLLASASLYPAMEKTYIDGIPYVDGGYRNNIPINLALRKNPDEVIVVDVHGPGLIKKDYQFDEENFLWISTKWHLGDLLLFHKARTEMNVELGYQETMKLAQKYEGLWYTFKANELKEEHTTFYLALDKWLNGKRLPQLIDLISDHNYQLQLLRICEDKWESEVHKDNLPLAIMECTAKIFRILPKKIYNIEDFQKEILYRVEKFQEQDQHVAPEELRPDFPLSGMEWTERFKEQLPFISNRRMMLYMLELIEDPELSIDNNMYRFLFHLRPFPFILALYVYYLKEKFQFYSHNR